MPAAPLPPPRDAEAQAPISSDEYRELEQIEDPEPEPVHYRHPTDPKLTWCGKPEKPGTNTYAGAGPVPLEQINCVDCLHLHIKKGATWWWNVHRAWYGTTCSSRNHQGCV